MSVINTLSDIIDNGLCIGCGICQSIDVERLKKRIAKIEEKINN